MRISNFFIQTLREDPIGAQIISHKLMLRAGMICNVHHGVYTWLPLGLRVLQKIEKIIIEEQNRIGCSQVLMPTTQPASLWEKSGRYDGYGMEMLRIKDRHGRELIYGPTHEEIATDMAARFIKSYRQLPVIFYQIGWKFRDEIRPRFGVMRGREFLMKDGYSFDVDVAGALNSYQKVFFSYLRIFRRLGLRAVPVRANTGAIGGNLSHEFHIMAEVGESELFYDKAFDEIDIENVSFDEVERIYTAADEKHDASACEVPGDRLVTARGVEVGHVFYFGDKYSKAMNFAVTGCDGQPFFPQMGSYGIGVSRLVAAIIEASHDEHGIVWPEAVSPFSVVIITAKNDDAKVSQIAEELYERLLGSGVDVLLDDRAERVGSKFSDMDLIGITSQIVVGTSALAGTLEWKDRKTGERSLLSFDEVVEKAVGRA
ncbi:MAG: proline--tRNA ligase [Holosporales bacterium]|jgi:prolyl-tRNA synthetase|nr:proline--tRNA ligase [Holosporales bacterium]